VSRNRQARDRAAPAQEAAPIAECRIGLLGGANAQDRLTSNACLRARIEELPGVPTSLLAGADDNGVIRGLPGGTLAMARLGPRPMPRSVWTTPPRWSRSS
jgi:phosphonate transport system substrate-binding protein